MFSQKCKPISTHSTSLNATLPPPFPHQTQVSPFKNLTDRKGVVLVYTFGRTKYFSYFEPYTKTIRCFDLSHIWLVVFFLMEVFSICVHTPMGARRGHSSLWIRVPSDVGAGNQTHPVLWTAEIWVLSPVPQLFLFLWVICLCSLFMFFGT